MVPALYAAQVGKVLNFRGDISVLRSSDKNVVKAFRGMKLFENDIISSKKASFAKIKGNDGTMLTVGAKSTMKMGSFQKGKTSVVSLLSGIVRSNVSKIKEKRKVKLLVKTKSAAMGVRGTEFLVSFNRANNTTSTITYSGEVVVTNIDALKAGNASALKQLSGKNIRVLGAGQITLSKPGDKRPTKPKVVKASDINKLKRAFDNLGEKKTPTKATMSSSLVVAKVENTSDSDVESLSDVVDDSNIDDIETESSVDKPVVEAESESVLEEIAEINEAADQSINLPVQNIITFDIKVE